jgi:hypothetical protein
MADNSSKLPVGASDVKFWPQYDEQHSLGAAPSTR